MVTVWTEERNQWLFQHGSESPKELYRLFCEAFPDVKTTVYGVANQRSRIGACARHNTNSGTRKAKPLYSEQIKKHYVRIKVAQPSTWMQKNKWVWLETHPWLYNTVQDNDNFIFLDGDNRNFSPDNIEKVSAREMAIINSEGKLPKGKPEFVMNKIAMARLKIIMLDKAEKIGLCTVVKTPNCKYRILKSKANANRKKYYQEHKNDEGFMEKIREKNRKYNRQKSAEAKERSKIVKRNWYMRKREEKNEN